MLDCDKEQLNFWAAGYGWSSGDEMRGIFCVNALVTLGA